MMHHLHNRPWPEGVRLEDVEVLAETMTKTCVPALSELAPHSGAYMNEVGEVPGQTRM